MTSADNQRTIRNWLSTLANIYHIGIDFKAVDLWLRVLRPYPSEAIDYAFDQHTLASDKLPKPSDILRLVQAYMLEKKEKEQEKKRLEEQAEIKRRLANGEQRYGLADFLSLVRKDFAKFDMNGKHESKFRTQ